MYRVISDAIAYSGYLRSRTMNTSFSLAACHLWVPACKFSLVVKVMWSRIDTWGSGMRKFATLTLALVTFGQIVRRDQETEVPDNERKKLNAHERSK
jgi:hypothetical protein